MRMLGNAIKNIVGSWNIVSDALGWVWGTATGGAKGPGTINAQGLFVNGVAVSTASAGITAQVVTSSGTSRTSTTAITADAQLTIAVVAAGTYKVELYAGTMTGILAGQGGIQAQFGLSAANATSQTTGFAIMAVADGTSPGLNNSIQGVAVSNSLNVGNCAFYPGAAYNSAPALTMSATVVLNAATTINVSWGQASSNATATTINAGATLIVTKIA